jgi:ABC-2 type transport system permease protein
MRRALALLHASWLTARTYRVQLAMSVAALVGTLIPLYFVAQALQKVMESRIEGEGTQYFAFLLVGMISLQLIQSAMNAVPAALGGALGTGVLEALMSTRARPHELMIGLSAYDLCWALVRGAAMLAAGVALGARLEWSRLAPALAIVALLILVHLTLGIFGAAFMLYFRTQSPIARVLTLVSGFLGGVYYPTTVIPGWLGTVSDFVPLSHALRALRAVWLDGAPLSSVAWELQMLGAMGVSFGAVSVLLLSLAWRHVRRVGGLSYL